MFTGKDATPPAVPNYQVPRARYSFEGLLRALEHPNEPSFERDFAVVNCDPIGEEHQLMIPHRPGAVVSLPTRSAVRVAKRDLTVGVSSAGGDLAFSTAMAVAAAARPRLVLDQAGVEVVQLTAKAADLTFPRWSPETVPGGWVGEGSSGSELNLETATATASPRQAYAHVELSRQLRKSVADVEGAVLGELARAVRGVLETGFLQGIGSESQPLGLCSMVDADTDAQEVNFAGSVPTLPEINDMMAAYLSAHGSYDRAVWIAPSALAVSLLETEKATQTGQFIAEASLPNGLSIQGRPLLVSDYMPAGQMLLFDPSTIRQVFWASPFALLDRYSDNRDLRGDAMLLIYNICDVVSLYPAQVVVGR